MSNADKLFYELGYEKYSTNDLVGYYQYDENSTTICIVFILDKKSVALRYDGSNSPAITMQELKAINMKCKELGWLGDEDV